MADIRPIDTPAQTGPGIPDEALGPGEDAAFEAELEEAEAEEKRDERERHPFGENPDGIGPTLGMDIDTDDEAYDPPT
jgi:hypothetical protein